MKKKKEKWSLEEQISTKSKKQTCKCNFGGKVDLISVLNSVIQINRKYHQSLMDATHDSKYPRCVCVCVCVFLVTQLLYNCLRLCRKLLCPWGFSRQEYWSGLSCPPPRDLPNPGLLHCRWILYQLSYPGSPIQCIFTDKHEGTKEGVPRNKTS